MFLRELCLAYKRREDIEPIAEKPLACPGDAAAILIPILEHESVEVFAVLCLTSKHTVLCYHELSRGTLDACVLHPREVFKVALLANAAGLVLAHNHPSGDPEPSPDDLSLTRRIQQAGELMGIAVVDHVIVGDGRYYSFKEGGQL